MPPTREENARDYRAKLQLALTQSVESQRHFHSLLLEGFALGIIDVDRLTELRKLIWNHKETEKSLLEAMGAEGVSYLRWESR